MLPKRRCAWTITLNLEPDFVVFDRRVSLGGPDVLLAVEVADSSLGYDLGRKAQIYAAFGSRELG